MNSRKTGHRLIFAFVLVFALVGLAPAPAARAGAPVTVSLTFDDGYLDQYKEAFPILEEHGMKATFYIMSSVISNGSSYMTWDQLREVATAGHEIGGHTLNHKDLTRMSVEEARHQVCQDRANLLGRNFYPYSFAYPNGSRNATVEQIVAACGYNSGRGIKPGPESIPPVNRYNLRAAPTIRTGTTAADFKKWVTDAENNGGGWLIFIFHHVCTRCQSGYTVPAKELDAFLDWLEPRAAGGTVVKTVNEVISEPFNPRVNQ